MSEGPSWTSEVLLKMVAMIQGRSDEAYIWTVALGLRMGLELVGKLNGWDMIGCEKMATSFSLYNWCVTPAIRPCYQYKELREKNTEVVPLPMGIPVSEGRQ